MSLASLQFGYVKLSNSILIVPFLSYLGTLGPFKFVNQTRASTSTATVISKESPIIVIAIEGDVKDVE